MYSIALLNSFLDRLENVSGRGDNYRAACPRCAAEKHRPHDNALSITVKGDRILCNCHRCQLKHIGELRNALKLQPASAELPPTASTKRKRTYSGPAPWEREIESVYRYADVFGRTCYEKVRFARHDRNGGSGPKYMVRRPHESRDGMHRWSIGNTDRVLYNLPLVLVSADVWIVEGEKDADRLIANGLTATTDYAGAWQPNQNPKWDAAAYNPALALKRIFIIPDNDSPGMTRAAYIAASLARTAASVQIVNLPDLPEGGDVSDFLDAGNSISRLRALAEQSPLFDAGIAALFAKSRAIDDATATGVEQWTTGATRITRTAQSCDCGKCKGAAVVSFYAEKTTVHKMRSASHRECAKERHRYTKRIVQKIYQEAKRRQLYFELMPYERFMRWTARNRKAGQTNRFFAIHLSDDTTALISTARSTMTGPAPADTGSPIPTSGDEVYDMIEPLVIDCHPDRRNCGTQAHKDDKREAFGYQFQGSRGDGRRKQAKRNGKKWECSQYIATNATAQKVCAALGAEYNSNGKSTVNIKPIPAYNALSDAGIELQKRHQHAHILSVSGTAGTHNAHPKTDQKQCVLSVKAHELDDVKLADLPAFVQEISAEVTF